VSPCRIAAVALALWACGDGGGPTPPPALTFDLLRGANRGIYRARIDGADTLRLTSDTADDRQPTSAGGTIVFVSNRDGNAELYSLPAEGGSPTRLTVTAANEGDPALSPDGTRLAYTRDDGGVPRLWIANANGSGGVRVTDSLDFGGALDASPSWSPGSDRVAFVSTTSGSARLYALTLNGMTIAPLLPDTAPDVEPSWSPDGKRLAFTSGAGGGTRIAILDLTTHAVTRITPASSRNGEPAWLPDGRLVFLEESGSPVLVWIDPAAPSAVHSIDVGTGTPGHPAAIRP
jgi:Tol biopolymer transport system component